MKTPSKISEFLLGLMLMASLAAPSARAFSLLGPFESWMTTTNGFDPQSAFGGTDIGGPMSLGQGYRWNVPVVTYAFDDSFLEYFGSNGVAAVNSAISLLNSLPPASQLSPGNYGTNVTGVNYQAESENLVDLKSETLSLLLEHLGLASPDRFVYTLKEFIITNGAVDGLVLMRSYDPVTIQASPYVDGTLYSYVLAYSVTDGATNAAAYTYAVNPLAAAFSAVADGLNGQETGWFYEGLTSDDIGGLAYLYTTNRITYETLPPDVQSTGTNAMVNGTVRAGVDKVTFVYQPFDQLLNQAFSPTVVQFTDTYYTNGAARQQTLQRVITQPDFLFTVKHQPGSDNLCYRTGTTNWINNSLILGGQPSAGGPGVILPPVSLAFNELGPAWQSYGSAEDTASAAAPTHWGTYDGTTNPPIVYPQSSGGTGPTPVQLTLMLNNLPVSLALTTGTSSVYNFQTSTNLNDWNTLFAITNNGIANSYVNFTPVSTQRFYRLVPQ